MTDATSAARRPNIIVFLTDQQRWDTTGLAGNPLDLTPNLDRMAHRGTSAECAITPNPLCAPARASLQTGVYPTNTGVYRNQLALPADTPTLAGTLSEAGYHCGYIGKWHLSDHGPGPVPAGSRAGYQSWLASNALEFTSDAYRTIVYDEADAAVCLPGYRPDALTDAAIRFVADHHDEPFFLFISYLEPHQQNELDLHEAPDGYAERYAGRWMPPDLASLGSAAHKYLPGYYGQVKRLDECLGRLLDVLRSTELLDTTIVAFTSDHGNHFHTRKGGFKRSCHDASIRVPFALRGPGFDGGGCISGIVNTIDLPPTLLDAAAVPIPGSMQGSSLLPAVLGRRRDLASEAFAQVSESEVGRLLRTDRYKYYVNAPGADPHQTGSAARYQEDALYDLHADPYELVDLVHSMDHAGVRERLRARLVSWIQRVEGVPVEIVAAEPRQERHRVDPMVRTNELTATRFGHQSRTDKWG